MAQYKMAGDWDTAAATTTRMAELLRKQGAVRNLNSSANTPNHNIFYMFVHNYISPVSAGDLTGAGRLYGEAGTCYRKHSPSLAVAAYLKVASCHQSPLQSLNCRPLSSIAF